MAVREWREDAVAHVQLARPESRNALDRSTVAALHAAVGRAAADRDVRCLVLSGAGESFSAGGDIHALRAQSGEETLALNAEMLAVVDELDRLPFPSIAALHGHALGGGLELALGCTLRVASTTATIGLPEARIGLIPGSGGIARLPRLIPSGVAQRMLLTGETISGAEAHALGLVQSVAEPDAVLAGATALAERIAANGPLAVRAMLEILRSQDPAPVRDAIAESSARLAAIVGSDDLAEGLEAFVTRRPPSFRGL